MGMLNLNSIINHCVQKPILSGDIYIYITISNLFFYILYYTVDQTDFFQIKEL